jgi:hypothetical protein
VQGRLNSRGPSEGFTRGLGCQKSHLTIKETLRVVKLANITKAEEAICSICWKIVNTKCHKIHHMCSQLIALDLFKCFKLLLGRGNIFFLLYVPRNFVLQILWSAQKRFSGFYGPRNKKRIGKN